MAHHHHDDLERPVPHQVKKSTVDAVLDGLIKGCSGLVSLVSGLLAAVLILYSGYVIYDTFHTEYRAYTSAWDLLQYKPEIMDSDLKPVSGVNTLASINRDYRAWLSVYGTAIDYPVVQGANDVYYAAHDVYGNPSLSGAIYLSAGNSADFSDSYNLVYGHHMDNGAMFGGLDSFRDPAYFEAHRSGLVVAGTEVYDVAFFAVASTDAYETRVYNVGNGMTDVIDFLSSGGAGGIGIGTEVLIFDAAALEGAEKVIALSTCASAETNGRLVLFGVMRRRENMTFATIVKVWDDDDNRDGLRPETVTVTLTANGEPVREIVLSADGNWSGSIVGLPMFADGAPVTYAWNESPVSGYVQTVNAASGTTTTIVNTHAVETTDLTITKVWDDDGDAAGIRPESVTFYLMGNDQLGGQVVLTEANGWRATLTVPRCANGSAIVYRWLEPSVAGYKPVSEAVVDGETTVTNALIRQAAGQRDEHKLIINYRGLNGAGLAPSVAIILKEGDAYDVLSPTIEGYRCLQAHVTGIIHGRDVEVTVFYMRTDEGVAPAGGNESGPNAGRVIINVGDCFE